MPIYINTYTNQSTADEPKPERKATLQQKRKENEREKMKTHRNTSSEIRIYAFSHRPNEN